MRTTPTPARPRRVTCTNPSLSTHGLFGTVVGRSVRACGGDLLDVVWLDYPAEGSDEIADSNVQTVTEGAFMAEVVERRLDEARD